MGGPEIPGGGPISEERGSRLGEASALGERRPWGSPCEPEEGSSSGVRARCSAMVAGECVKANQKLGPEAVGRGSLQAWHRPERAESGGGWSSHSHTGGVESEFEEAVESEDPSGGRGPPPPSARLEEPAVANGFEGASKGEVRGTIPWREAMSRLEGETPLPGAPKVGSPDAAKSEQMSQSEIIPSEGGETRLEEASSRGEPPPMIGSIQNPDTKAHGLEPSRCRSCDEARPEFADSLLAMRERLAVSSAAGQVTKGPKTPVQSGQLWPAEWSSKQVAAGRFLAHFATRIRSRDWSRASRVPVIWRPPVRCQCQYGQNLAPRSEFEEQAARARQVLDGTGLRLIS